MYIMIRWSDEAMQLSVQLLDIAKLKREQGKTIYFPQIQIFKNLNLTSAEQVEIYLVAQDMDEINLPNKCY